MQPVRDIVLQPQRTIEIGSIRKPRQQHCRRHRDRTRHHATHHDAQSARTGAAHHGKRFGQAAGLVELDVHGIVAPREVLQLGARMRAFVSADRHRSRPAHQTVILAGREGLFDQHHAKPRRRLRNRWQLVCGEALIGIDNQTRLGAGRMHGLDPGKVVRPAEFQLQEPARRRLRHSGHGLRRVEADRDGGFQRLRLRQARQFPDGDPGLLRFEVPERTVDRAACSAGGQAVLQLCAAHPGFQFSAHLLDRGDHAVDRFAIAAIGDALAAPLGAALAKADPDGLGARLRAARNRKRRLQGR